MTEGVVAGRHRPVLIGALAVAGAAYLRVADPHDPAVPMPRCPTRALTGLDCPACGGLRMVSDLLRGDVRRAARDNAFLLVTGPVLASLLVAAALDRRRGGEGRVPARPARVLAAAALTWMVVRNLPAWRWRPTTA